MSYTLYKEGEEPKVIHEVDVPAWLADGWSKKDIKPTQGAPEYLVEANMPAAIKNEVVEQMDEWTLRLNALKALSWQELSALATKYELTKPEGMSWKEYVPEILAAEQRIAIATAPVPPGTTITMVETPAVADTLRVS